MRDVIRSSEDVSLMRSLIAQLRCDGLLQTYIQLPRLHRYAFSESRTSIYRLVACCITYARPSALALLGEAFGASEMKEAMRCGNHEDRPLLHMACSLTSSYAVISGGNTTDSPPLPLRLRLHARSCLAVPTAESEQAQATQPQTETRAIAEDETMEGPSSQPTLENEARVDCVRLLLAFAEEGAEWGADGVVGVAGERGCPGRQGPLCVYSRACINGSSFGEGAHGLTPLAVVLASTGQKRQIETLSVLLQHGADVNDCHSARCTSAAQWEAKCLAAMGYPQHEYVSVDRSEALCSSPRDGWRARLSGVFANAVGRLDL